MALFVVIAGALLIIGGASFLALGFDIVMTERGAAMTIGGVVALSSGVIAVGIGFALSRLSQILRVLDLRAKGGSGAGKGNRSVVPLAAAEPERGDVPAPEPQMVDRLTSAVSVAGGAALAGGAATALAASHDAHSADPILAMPVDDAPPRGVSTASTVIVPPDLEAELARALSDTSPSPAPARSFVDDPAIVPAKASKRKQARALANAAGATGVQSGMPAVEVEALSGLPDAPAAMQTAKSDQDADWPSAVVADHPGFDEAAPSLPAGRVAEAMETDAPIGPTGPDGRASVSETPASDPSGLIMSARREALMDDREFDDLRVNAPASSQEATVLGTYNIGGRTYSMYSDGSVKAITESGIQRFESMDDLRQHLAKV